MPSGWRKPSPGGGWGHVASSPAFYGVAAVAGLDDLSARQFLLHLQLMGAALEAGDRPVPPPRAEDDDHFGFIIDLPRRGRLVTEADSEAATGEVRGPPTPR